METGNISDKCCYLFFFPVSAHCLLILISTFCASAMAPLSSALRVFFSFILLTNTATSSLPLSLQMLQHNQKFPLFFPSCIFSRFPCGRSPERKLKVIRALLFVYPLSCVRVGFSPWMPSVGSAFCLSCC